MEIPPLKSTPVPKPRTRRSWSTPHASSHSLIPHIHRPGVLVEARQPFSTKDIAGMLRWQIGKKVGGEEQIKDIILSPDRTRAIVEFAYSGGKIDIYYLCRPKCRLASDWQSAYHPLVNEHCSYSLSDCSTQKYSCRLYGFLTTSTSQWRL